MAIINGTSGNDRLRFVDNPDGGDTFLLGEGNDRVFANIGPDIYDGGLGTDTVSYAYATSGVTLSLVGGGTAGMALGHTYISIERLIGSAFNDNITGSAGADVLRGGDGRDTLNGGEGNDRLYGDDGNDTLNGEGGNDRIFGGEGHDTIYGGAGNDYIEGGAGADYVIGGDGIDTIGFSTALEGVTADLNAPPPQAPPLDSAIFNDGLFDVYYEVENIYGSDFDDTLRGDSGSNLIKGQDGDDSIYGREGNDRLYGGLGDDYISGGDGDDRIYGGDGDDSIYGGDGRDRIYAGDGEDDIEGGEGNDFIYMTQDNENDYVYGGINTNGDGPSIDTGFDTVSYAQSTAGVSVEMGSGGIFPVGPPVEHGKELTSPLSMELEFGTFDFLSGIERVIGSNFDDFIFGGREDDLIIGGDGDDIIDGGGGRDRLIGGNGADDFGFYIRDSDVDSILDFTQGVDTITFFTEDESLIEADVLATLTDFGGYWVFEFGLIGDGTVEQRLAVIKDDPDQVLTVDDFTIEIIELSPPREPDTQEPLVGDFAGQSFAADDMAFYDFGALI